MEGSKIESLNFAVHEAIPAMQETASENPNAQVLVRAVTFSDGAKWHMSTPTPVADFTWSDIEAGGLTDMGKALCLVAEQLKIPPMTDRALPPVLVLISDGQATDDFGTGLKNLMAEPWGKKAVRLAVAVGEDADLDALTRFIGRGEIYPLKANNSPTLVRYIRWASTAVLKSASSPPSRPTGTEIAGGNVAIPAPPPTDSSADDVW
jgi:uncharacterized protein YegL